MGIKASDERTLRAALCEVERGLFRVSYRMEGAGLGKHQLPLYQLGTCAADARLLIEQQVRESGFTSVVWDDLLTDTPIPQAEASSGLQLSL